MNHLDAYVSKAKTTIVESVTGLRELTVVSAKRNNIITSDA